MWGLSGRINRFKVGVFSFILNLRYFAVLVVNMHRHFSITFLLLGILLISCTDEVIPQRSSEFGPEMQQIVFVCDHGSVRSLMSSMIFNEIAEARGLNYTSISRGLTPDENVPSIIVDAFKSEGKDVSAYKPKLLSSSEIASATRVISIEADLSAYGDDAPVEQWNDVPSASLDFKASQDEMRQRIESLIDDLAKASNKQN